MKVSVNGGAPVRVTEVGGGALRGASWSIDGAIFFSGQSAGISRVSVEDGLVEKITIPDIERGEKSHRYPQVLPGGKAVLFTLGTGDIDLFDDASIAVLSLATGDYRVVLEGGTNAHYSHTGHLVYGRRGELVAVPFDLESATVTGGPVTVLAGVISVPIAGTSSSIWHPKAPLSIPPGRGRGRDASRGSIASDTRKQLSGTSMTSL